MIDRKGEVNRLKSAIERARAQLDSIEGWIEDGLDARECAEALLNDAGAILRQVAVIGFFDELAYRHRSQE